MGLENKNFVLFGLDCLLIRMYHMSSVQHERQKMNENMLKVSNFKSLITLILVFLHPAKNDHV